MKEKIKKTMASVFDINVSEINENSSSDTIKNWDSLHHMNLIVALEEEFGVAFTDSEMVDLDNYERILEALNTKGIQ